MSLLCAHAPGVVSGNHRPLQGSGPLRLQRRPTDRPASLGHACRRGRQLPGRAERRCVLDLRRLPARARRGDQRTRPQPAKSFEALDRIARQEATLGKLDTARLDACLSKQDETQIKASLKEADALGLEGTPDCLWMAKRSMGLYRRSSCGPRLIAPFAPTANSPRRSLLQVRRIQVCRILTRRSLPAQRARQASRFGTGRNREI